MGNVCVLMGNVCVLLGKNKTCNICHSNEKTIDRMTIVMKCEPKFESIVPVKIIISSNDLFFLFCVLIISSIFCAFTIDFRFDFPYGTANKTLYMGPSGCA